MQFGAYIVERPVEQRGKVTIYAARHETSGEAALISAFVPDAMDEAYRWAERLAAIQQLRHPNIITPGEGSRTAQGVPFALSPFAVPILGRDRVLTPAETLEVIRAIAPALDYAHDQGLVHGTLRTPHMARVGDRHFVLRGFELAGAESTTAAPVDDVIALSQWIYRALIGQNLQDNILSASAPDELADVVRNGIKGHYLSAGALADSFEGAVKSLPSGKRNRALVDSQNVGLAVKKSQGAGRTRFIALILVLVVVAAALGIGYSLLLGFTATPPLPTLIPSLSVAEVSTVSTEPPSDSQTAEVKTAVSALQTTEISAPTLTATATFTAQFVTENAPTLSPLSPTPAGIDLTETASAQTMSTLPAVVTATPFFVASYTPNPSVIAVSPAVSPTVEVTPSNTATFSPQAAKPCVSIVGDSVTHGGVTYNIPDVGYIIGLTKPVAEFVNDQLRAQGINDLIAFDRGASNTGINTDNHPSYFRSTAYTELMQDNCQYTVIMPWFNDISPGQVPQEDAAPQHVRALIELVRSLAAQNPAGRIFILNYYDGDVAGFAAQTWASGFTPANRERYNHEIKLSCDFGSLHNIPEVACLTSNDAFQGMGNGYVIGFAPINEVESALLYPINEIQQQWLDEYKAYNPTGLLEGDGIHLSTAGKAALAAYIVQAIQSLPASAISGQSGQ